VVGRLLAGRCQILDHLVPQRFAQSQSRTVACALTRQEREQGPDLVRLGQNGAHAAKTRALRSFKRSEKLQFAPVSHPKAFVFQHHLQKNVHEILNLGKSVAFLKVRFGK